MIKSMGIQMFHLALKVPKTTFKMLVLSHQFIHDVFIFLYSVP